MTRSLFRLILPVLIMLGGGVLLGRWMMERAEREMRADMVERVRLIALGMNSRHLKVLEASSDDESRPEYQRMREQLQVARAVYPQCRFIYLAGRRADGSIFFFMDSEPAGSKELSPPGQLYPEGSAVFRRVFETKRATTEGPLPDRWGVWVSAFAPVTDTPTGLVLAVLGMDVDARDWRAERTRAAAPAILFTLALVTIWVAGATLLDRRVRLKRTAPIWMRRLEPGLVVATGLTLSTSAAWLAFDSSARHQTELFGNLANHQAGVFVERLQNVRDLQLEGLGRYYLTRDYVTTEEFQTFTRSLTRNVSVTTWGWIPVISAAERERFEAAARKDGLPDFEIWESDAQGNRVRAGDREVYYPVFQVAPGARIGRVTGYDSGTEPRRLAALQEATATRLTTATEPVTLSSETGDQKGLVIYRPVASQDDPGRPRGFVGASLRLENFLRFGVTPDRVPLVELSLLHRDAPAETLARTWEPDNPPASGRFQSRPVFAFGKVFQVTVHAGPEFGPAGPRWAGGLAFAAGLALTGTLATLVRFILRRRERLEQLVAERTTELRLSEESYRNQFANSSAVMLLIAPEDGAIIDANASAVAFYGYSRDRLLAMRISEINVKSDAEIKQLADFIVQGWRNRFEFQHRLADGSIRDVAVAASSIQHGGRTIVHTIVQDVTEQKRVTQELEAAHHILKERLKEIRCLYAITKLTGESRGSLGELLQAAVKLIPAGWHFHEVARARISCNGQEFVTAGFRPTPWLLSTDLLVSGQPAGKVEVCYLEERPGAEEGPFMHEERVLLTNLATQIGAAIERKQAEGKLRQLSSIIEQAPLSVVITTFEGVIEYVNPKFCAVTGYTREEAVGQNIRTYRSTQTPFEVNRDLWATIADRRVWSGEVYSRRKNGESYLETLVAAPLFDENGRPTHVVSLRDDITAQRRFEAETTAMLEKERELSKVKSQFISVASHEFRTPLAAAVGSLELLERHSGRITEAKRLELLARIKNSLSRLTTIMDDVLHLSRADSGRVKVSRMNVDLVQFVQDIIQQVEAGDRQQHRFVFARNGTPETVPADTKLLHHILSNLVGNAVRYSPAGTQISIKLEVNAAAVIFDVADEGIGIPEADRERIFEPFVRGSNVGQIGGTGLGLNIVKKYVELLGGRIEVLPVERGTTFRVALPLVQPETHPCT